MTKERCDDCLCDDPYRQNDKMIRSDLNTVKREQEQIWTTMDTKLTTRQFALTMTLLVGLTVAMLSVTITETNNSIRALVTVVQQTRDDVLIIKGQRSALHDITCSEGETHE